MSEHGAIPTIDSSPLRDDLSPKLPRVPSPTQACPILTWLSGTRAVTGNVMRGDAKAIDGLPHLGHHCCQVFVFPYPKYVPAGYFERVRVAPVAFSGTFELCPPPSAVRSRVARVLRTSVPVTPVDEDGQPLRREQDVHRACQSLDWPDVLSEAKPFTMERRSHARLERGVPRAVGLHTATDPGRRRPRTPHL